MRTIALSLIAILLSPLGAAEAGGEWQRWEGCTFLADRFHDGDSFQVKYGGKIYVLRLYGVDAPETDDGYGTRIAEQAEYFGIMPAEVLRGSRAAKEFTERFLSKPFTVITRRKVAPGASRSERIYAIVERNGAGLDAALVDAGLARAVGESADFPDAASGQRRAQELRGIEQRAAHERNGLWSKSQRADRRGTWKDRLLPRFMKPKELPAPNKVNLNTASAADIEALPGIGAKTAEQIIRARPLKDMNSLDVLPGFGPKKIEALRDLVTF